MNEFARYARRNPKTVFIAILASVVVYFVVPIQERREAITAIVKTVGGSVGMRVFSSVIKNETKGDGNDG